jgi:hypothetical protein
MLARVFGWPALLFLLVVALAAFAVGAIKSRDAKRGLEAGLLALFGGFLARTFVSILLSLGNDSPGTAMAIGWGFFLWPGAIDSIAAIFGARLLTTPASLLWIAAAVGSVVGMTDGVWAIRPWRGVGVLSFLLDTTWGLAGSANGSLLHLVNTAWAGHASDPRPDAHRYSSGFRFKHGFAFTQGSVMSNMGTNGPGTALFVHEKTHVWQNRAFGPFFALTYLGWMVLMFVPGLIVGLATRKGAGAGIEQWCYFNNPWEAWAYKVGQKHGAGARTAYGSLVWQDSIVLVASIPFTGFVIAVFLPIILSVW